MAVKVGSWRVDPDDLEAFIARRKARTQSVTPAAAVASVFDADRLFDVKDNRFL